MNPNYPSINVEDQERDSDSVMAYYRKTDSQQILIAGNFGEAPVTLNLDFPVQQVLLSNMGRTDIPSQHLKLDSCEVIVLELRLCDKLSF